MRLPRTAHTERPWRIHELTDGFDLLDVWRLPTPGGPDDFPALVGLVADREPGESGPWAVRALFALRMAIGRVLRWDEGEGFTEMYRTENEYAAEIVNTTVHGIMHLGWVEEGDLHTGQMAILVKPKGLLGRIYMAAISPFRHAVVYPAMLRRLEHEWARR